MTKCMDPTLSNTSILQGLTVGGNTSLSKTVITGTTDINLTGSATTTIGNSGSATNVSGTFTVVGVTSINTVGSGTTIIGSSNSATTALNSVATTVGGTLGVTGRTTLGNASCTSMGINRAILSTSVSQTKPVFEITPQEGVIQGGVQLGTGYGLYNLPYSSTETDGGFTFRSTNSNDTTGTSLLRIQNTPVNTITDPPGSYTGTDLSSTTSAGFQSVSVTTISGGYRYTTYLNVMSSKMAVINSYLLKGQMYKVVFTLRSTTSDTYVYFESGNGGTIVDLGLIGNVMKTYTYYGTSPNSENLYIGVNGNTNMQRIIEYQYLSIEPVYNTTVSSLTATSLGTNSLLSTNLKASNMLICETETYAPFDKFRLQVVGNHENGLAIFPKINGTAQISNIAMYAPFGTNFNNDFNPKRCADIYAGRISTWQDEYIAFGVGNGTNYDHNKTITRMSINGAENTTVTIGQINYKGNAANNTTLDLECSRHTIAFSGFHANSFRNGASISCINKQTWTTPTDRSAMQSADLIFSLAPIAISGDPVERMRIMDSGRVGINTVAPTALLDVNGSLVYSTAETRSDRRIKTDILDVEDQQALIDLRRLKPKTYGYKDSKERGNGRVYGFIAQEVKEVLNYAGDLTKDYIPNIYEDVDFVNDILTFTTFNTSSLERDASGDIFTKLKVKTKSLQNEYLTIVEVLDEHTLKVDTNSWSKDASGQLICPDNPFVYGQEVDNFNTLNKDAIWTVATAALQEVDRQLQAEKQKTAALQTTFDALLERVVALEKSPRFNIPS